MAEEITVLLQRADAGEPGAMDALMEAVYADLERIAAGKMRQQFGAGMAGVTLEPAALVHETFLKLIDQSYRFENRRHYFALATQVMLRVLVDYHRRRGAAKRGGDQIRLTLTGIGEDAGRQDEIAVQDIAEAIERLEALDSTRAEVVKLKVIWGFTTAEIARTLDLSTATVERYWRFARAWLAGELDGKAT